MSLALWLPYMIAFMGQWAFAGVEVPSGKGDGTTAMYNHTYQKAACVQGPAVLVPDGKGGQVWFCQVK